MSDEGLRLMSVHAHADDETITMGGTLALCADRGITTCNVCCTDGKLATIVDPSMPEEETRPRLAEIRQAELRAAMGILGVNEVVFLGYGDSGMAGADTNKLPDAFWMASLDEAAGRIVEQIRRFRPHVVVTYDAYGSYGHPDHIQTHRAALLAVEAAHIATMYPEGGEPWMVRKLYYTAFPRFALRRMVEASKDLGIEPPFGVENVDDLPFLSPDSLVTTTIDCRTTLRRKREALRAHRSQIAPDWPMLAVPEELAMNFADEYFQRVVSRGGEVTRETDLFEEIVTASAVPV